MHLRIWRLALPSEFKAIDGKRILVFIPVAKKEVEAERKKETDNMGRSCRQRKVLDGHRKTGKRVPIGSWDHFPQEAAKALKSSGPKIL